MDAVILCAGFGSRMGSLSLQKPKTLIKVAGRSILERHIILLGSHVDRFIIVSNEKFSQAIEKALCKLNVNFEIVINKYPEKGNGYSFILAFDHIKSKKFILTMGDHIYEKDFIEEAVKKEGLIVDRKGYYIDPKEATKVKVKRGRIEDIGKDLKEFDGFDTGFFILSKARIKKEILESLKKEKTIEMKDVAKKLSLKAAFLDGKFWMDIDTKEDVEKAKRNLINLAIKTTEDGFVSRHINRKISTKISEYLIDNIEPWQATIGSTIFGIISALIALSNLYLGVIFYQISSILDGVDGEIARAAIKESKLGGWLDSVLDRIVDFLVICGLSMHLKFTSFNVFLALWMLFSSVMVSYVSERYKGAMQRSLYADFPQIMKIPGKRDERIFILMLLVIITNIKFSFFVVALLATFRICYTLNIVGKRALHIAVITILISSAAWGECLFLFRPEFKAYISKELKEESKILITIHGGLSSAEKSYKMCSRFSEKFPEFIIISLDFSPSPIGRKDVDEAVKLINWIKTQNPKEVDLLGKSYGGYIALMAATKTHFNSLIIIGAPTEPKKMLEFINKNPQKFQKWKESIEASRRLCKINKIPEEKCMQELSPVQKASSIDERLLIIHGTKDTTVPITQALYLIEALIKNKKKDFTAYIYPATHDIDPLQGRSYNIIKEFLSGGEHGVP